jgi:spermidine/putrescine transport system substrate-binding protein
MSHPKDRRDPISRREFLRRAGVTGVALPSMAAILAACSNDTGGGTGSSGASGGTTGGLQLARPDNPVTIPITGDNPAIPDGMQPEAGPLKILGYSAYIWKKVLNEFTAATGADVEYSVFDTPEQMVQKVQAGGSDFDLIATVTLENVGKLAQGGLIQPLNRTYIPNFSNLWQSLQSPFYDVNSQYTVPYTVYTTGIGFRNDLVTDDIAAMDNPYDILFDPKYAGQTHLLNGARDTLSAALLRMGADVNTDDTAVLEQAKQMLLDGVAAMNWKFDHVDYNELGQFLIHQTWSGQVSYYQYYLPKGLDISQFSYVWPPVAAGGKDGILTNDVFAITKGATSPVLAHTMIDFLLDPTNAITNYSYEGFQPPIAQFDNAQAVSDGIVPANLANSLLTEDQFNLPNAVRELELAPTVNQLYQQIYQEVTGGA